MSDENIQLIPANECPSGRHRINIRVVSMEVEYKPTGISNIIITGNLADLPKKLYPTDIGVNDHAEIVGTCCKKAAEVMNMEVNLYE